MQKDELLNRRAFLIGGAAAARALRAMPTSPACTLTAEQEEGPYYVDYDKVRSDITEGKPGLPLRLRVALMHAKRCEPLSNVSLDIWHCDAGGIYSGFTANHPTGPGGRGGFPPGSPPSGDFGPPPPPLHHAALDATRFLRGLQTTDDRGTAEFATIYPGWYLGRAIHIHLKVHAGGRVAHTGQLFFPEEVTERIARLQPYAKHREVHRTTQDEDEIFESQHGASGMLILSRVDAKSDAGGFVATVTLAVDPDAVPEPVSMRGFGGPRP